MKFIIKMLLKIIKQILFPIEKDCNNNYHTWGKWELIPPLTFRNIPSIVIEQKRVCEKCDKTEIKFC